MTPMVRRAIDRAQRLDAPPPTFRNAATKTARRPGWRSFGCARSMLDRDPSPIGLRRCAGPKGETQLKAERERAADARADLTSLTVAQLAKAYLEDPETLL